MSRDSFGLVILGYFAVQAILWALYCVANAWYVHRKGGYWRPWGGSRNR